MECPRPPGAFPTPRRVFTAPTSLQPSSQRASSSSSTSTVSQGGSVETLYSHPSAKIIAFTSSTRSVPRSPTRGGPSEEEAGTLQSSSQLERTIAVGPFRIYRAPGSVAFLNCGSALQPILPKSQCWCIDQDSSRFVLQIRRPNFWRIELPVANADDQQRAELLKGVFDKILLFEKTQCPFKRSFTVTLPEPPQTPVKKKPWTPARRSFATIGPFGSLGTPNASPSPKSGRAVSEPPIEPKAEASPVPKQSEDEPQQERGLPVIAERPAEDGSKLAVHRSRPETEPTVEEEANLSRTREEIILPNTPTPSSGQAEDTKQRKIDAREEVQPLKGVEELDAVQAPVEHGMPVPKLEERRLECTKASPPTTVTPEEDTRQGEKPVDASLPKPQVADFEEDDKPPSRGIERRETPVRARDVTPVKVRDAVEAIEERLPEMAKSPETQVDEPTITITHESAVSTPTKTLVRKTSIPFIRNVREPRRRVSAEVLRSLSTPATPASPATPARPITPVIHEYDASEETRVAETMEETEPEGKGDCISSTVDEADETIDGILEGSGHGGNLLMKKKLRRNGFATGRSTMAPPQLTLVTSPPSKSANKLVAVPEAQSQPQPQAKEEATEERKRRSDSTSTDSADSFHSVQSETWQSPVTPPVPSPPAAETESQSSFPYPHENILLPRQASHRHHHHHQRDISDLTVTATPNTRLAWDEMSMSSGDISQESAMTAPDHALEPIDECAKSAISDDGACSTALRRGRSSIRHRSTTSISNRRAFSPLPPAATLFSPTTSSRRKPPPRRTRMEMVRRIPFAIVAKTCEVLFGPPAHLVTLMLKVAARIAAGEWHGLVFGFGDDGERIDVRWDYSDDDLSDWEHDGPVSPLRGNRVEEVVGGSSDDDGTTKNDDDTGRSWGVD